MFYNFTMSTLFCNNDFMITLTVRCVVSLPSGSDRFSLPENKK